MSGCDVGRCCRGPVCTNKKKCCCKAKAGNVFVSGEVCRTAFCITQLSCDQVDVCECDDSGGTLAQECGPCLFYPCDKCQTCVVNTLGEPQCVSICGICEECDTSTTLGRCAPKKCGKCEECYEGQCRSTGAVCGSPPNQICCPPGYCCVGGVCVSGACPGGCDPCQMCVCGACVTTMSGRPCGFSCCPNDRECCNSVCCNPGKVCCDAGSGALCSECNNSTQCAAGFICRLCACVEIDLCHFDNSDCGEPDNLATSSGGCPDSFDTTFEGQPCHVNVAAVTCDDIKCTYAWSSNATWSLIGGSYFSGQLFNEGFVMLPGSTPCSCDTCPAVLSIPAPTGPPYIVHGDVCTPGKNPLP